MLKCAFDRGDECSVLEFKKCQGCRFFKTDEQVKKSREKSEARISALPATTRRRILNKYQSSAKRLARQDG